MATSNDLNISQSGYVAFDGVATFSGRTFQAGTGITISNPDGVAGNSTIASTASLTDLHVAKWIVNPVASSGGNQTTIQAAINAASSGDVIFIYPGTYTENLTFTVPLTLVAFNTDEITGVVNISGNATINANGFYGFSGIRFSCNSASVITFSGSSTAQIVFENCYFLIFGGNTGISFTSSSALNRIYMYDCKGDVSENASKLFNQTSPGSLVMYYCKFTNGDFISSTSTNSTISAGNFLAYSSNINFAITTSGTSSIIMNKCSMSSNDQGSGLNLTFLTIGGSALNSVIEDTYIASGSSTAIVVSSTATLVNLDIDSTNTNAISGAGTVTFGNLTFNNTSSTISTTTQVPLITSNDALKVVTPGAYPYTTTAQDAIIKVDTSSARTIVPLASPTTGQKHIIKDTVGSAATNNITITPSGKNIDGAASSTININYGSATIVYSGSEWSIV